MKKITFSVGSICVVSALFLLTGCQSQTSSVLPRVTPQPPTQPVNNVAPVSSDSSAVKPLVVPKAIPAATAPVPAKAPSPVTMNIQNFVFGNKALSVKVGTKVAWINKDPMSHTVSSDNGVFASGNLATGMSFTYTFAKAGVYTYHCAIHPSMTGTVTVSS